nr:ORF2 [Luchacovirus sp.]
MAFAYKPTHFVNFPLRHFDSFYEAFLNTQRDLVFYLGCKLQSAPHVSISMLDARNSELRYIDFAIRDCIDYMYEGEISVYFSNLRLLGKHVICDVSGLDDWHDEVERYIRKAGYVCGQSRSWLPHVTFGSLDCDSAELDVFSKVIVDNGLSFNFKLDIFEGDSFYLDIVKIGATKHDGLYDAEFSAWVYCRFSVDPPTDKLGIFMGIACMEDIRIELEDDDLPLDDADAYYKLQYSYEYNGWFWRYCLSNSRTFRRHVQARRCTCLDSCSSDSD